MRAPLALVFLAISTTALTCFGAQPRDLSDALTARSMLGPETWARVVCLDNSHPRGAWRGRYPKTVYALVFEFSGILWIYNDIEGTQSLSQTLGTVPKDEAEPGPLFRGVEPGIAGWRWMDIPAGSPARDGDDPPNACFIESVRALNRRLASGFETKSPRLLFYYFETPTGRLGHTVLLFGAGEGLSVINFQMSDKPVNIPAYVGTDPRSVAQFIRGGAVSRARILAVRPSGVQAPDTWAFAAKSKASAG